MRTVLLFAALSLLPPGSAVAQYTAPAARDTTHAANVMLVNALTWGPAPAALPAGAQFAVIDGDPSQSGPYTIRLRMPDGYRIPPHSHPTAEYVTVLSGALALGMGDRMDEAGMKTLSAGSFGGLPAEMPHYVVARGETVVQVHGVGPFSIVYVNKADDPRQKAGMR